VKPEISALLQTPRKTETPRKKKKRYLGHTPGERQSCPLPRRPEGRPKTRNEWEWREGQTALEKDNTADLRRMPPRMKTASPKGNR